MLIANELRHGMTIIHNDDIFEVVSFERVKPGKGGAFVPCKLKNYKTGQVIQHKCRSQEKVERAKLDKKSMEYLYRESPMRGTGYQESSNHESHHHATR